MAAYRSGDLYFLTRFGPNVDELTKEAAELVFSMEDAFGSGRDGDLTEKITATRDLLEDE